MAKNERKSTRQNKLLQRLGIARYKNPETKQSEVVPGKESKKDPTKIIPINFPSDLKKTWEFFKNDVTIANPENNYENRINRYKELEFMVYNEGYMHTCALIYTNETTQADEQNRIIGIKAQTKEVEKYFYQWLIDIGADNGVIQDTAWDLSVYADHFWLNSFDLESSKGITEIVPVDPYECVDRIEFQGVKVKKAMQENSGYSTFVNRYSNLQKLAKMFDDEANNSTDIAGWYKSYLFGFAFGSPENSVLTPPWYVNHFRRFASRSEFFPFGRPLFIGSLARYKSYRTTEMLIDMARVASFPKEVLQVQGSPDMTTEELAERVNDIREMYQNITSKTKNPDEIGIGEVIFTIDGLVNYDLLENRMNLDQIGDLKAKKEDLKMSTGIPMGYVDTRDRSWGQSGQLLLQQSKTVARNVYSNQTPILSQLTELFKFHLYLTNKFDGENTKFELYMNYPVVEESSDRMRLKSDSIRLATDILSNLGEQLGLDRGEALPSDIVKDVFGKYSFLDMEEVGQWVKEFEKTKELNEEKENDSIGSSKSKFFASVTLKKNKNIRERYDAFIDEDCMREAYFESKQKNGFQEGSFNGKHYVSSFGIDKTRINLVKELQDIKIED
jgi:hypothetical protein